MLTAALVTGAFAAGLAGTWSPCGLSMICTLAPRDAERPARAIGWVLALAAGCVAGGVVLFAALAELGRHAIGGRTGPAIAAGVAALLAAALDARGVRVVPQIRNQVPEAWRRRAPLPVAAAGYGVLLGLGFTTFVMSYTLWAVALVSLLAAGPGLGVAAGVAFGLGRALPIAVLAPNAGAPWALRAQDAMMQRAMVLRTVRLAGAALLALAGATLVAAPAQAAPRVVAHGVGPSVDGARLAFRRAGHGLGFVRRLGEDLISPFTARDVAVGGGWLAVLRDTTIFLAPLGQPPGVPATLAVPVGTDTLAVDAAWVVWRVPASTVQGRPTDRLFAQPRDGSAAARVVATIPAPAQLGPPSLSGDRLAFHVATRISSRIDVIDLATGHFQRIERRHEELLFPALDGQSIAYVEVDACRQRLIVQRGRRRRVLLTRYTLVRRDTAYDPNVMRIGRIYFCRGPRHAAAGNRMFWETALGARAAYLTMIDAAAPEKAPVILSIAR